MGAWGDCLNVWGAGLRSNVGKRHPPDQKLCCCNNFSQSARITRRVRKKSRQKLFLDGEGIDAF